MTHRPKDKRVRLSLCAAAVIAFGWTSILPASAQDRGEGPPKVIELEEMVIEGKVAKPQVFYVIGRSRVEYKGIKLERSFVHRIVESAKQNPF